VAPEPAATPAGALFRVQVGAFANRENADALMARLRDDGFAPYLVQEGRLHKVRVGAFRERPRANELVARLLARGYSATIVR
jgi:N-acetylmuramoyl-L-alanine amidase